MSASIPRDVVSPGGGASRARERRATSSGRRACRPSGRSRGRRSGRRASSAGCGASCRRRARRSGSPSRRRRRTPRTTSGRADRDRRRAAEAADRVRDEAARLDGPELRLRALAERQRHVRLVAQPAVVAAPLAVEADRDDPRVARRQVPHRALVVGGRRRREAAAVHLVHRDARDRAVEEADLELLHEGVLHEGVLPRLVRELRADRAQELARAAAVDLDGVGRPPTIICGRCVRRVGGRRGAARRGVWRRGGGLITWSRRASARGSRSHFVGTSVRKPACTQPSA